MVDKETALTLSEMVWNATDLARYLYHSCTVLEAPLQDSVSHDARHDWNFHMVNGVLSFNNESFQKLSTKTPIRCLIFAKGLAQYIGETNAQDLLRSLSSTDLETIKRIVSFVDHYVAPVAAENIVVICEKNLSSTLPSECLRLLLHLVPSKKVSSAFLPVTNIDLRAEQFCGATMTNLRAFFSKLECLDLSHTDITDSDIEMLSGFRALKDLNLSATSITNMALEPLSKCPLSRLQLQDTLLNDACIHFLKLMKGLDTLHLSSGNFSSRAIEQFEMMPLEVIWH